MRWAEYVDSTQLQDTSLRTVFFYFIFLAYHYHKKNTYMYHLVPKVLIAYTVEIGYNDFG